MPVTARLSRKFYDALGDEIANELVDWFNQVDLTYRSDLDRLNQQNLALFEARLDQRLDAFGALLDRRLTAFERLWTERFTRLESRVDRLEGRVDALEGRMEALEGRMDALETRMAALEAQFTAFVQSMTDRFTTLEARVGHQLARSETRMLRWTVGLWLPVIIGLVGLYLR